MKNTTAKTNTIKETSSKLKEFMNFHFTSPDKFYSNIIFGCKQPKVFRIDGNLVRMGIYNCRYIRTDKMDNNPIMDEIESFCMEKNDYYVTQNGFKDPFKRDSKSLFTLYNIVIDIDCHNVYGPIDKILDSCEFFLYDLFKEPDFPAPNTFVKTGRGIQLWWALEPVSYKLRYMYNAVRKRIVNRIDSLMHDIPTLQDMNVDKAASTNFVGYFRLPGSYNTKSQTWGTYDFIHDEKMNLVETYFDENPPKTGKWVGKKYRPAKRKKKTVKSNIVKSREMMLHGLFDLRPKGFEIGIRDYMILILYNAYLSTGKSEEEAWDAAMRLNDEFDKPLSEREIKTYMKTSKRKKYKFTNKKIIDILGLTENECKELNFHAAEEREKERSQKRKDKKKRNALIERLLRLGMTQAEAAERAKCSESTVSRLAKKCGIKPNRKRRTEKPVEKPVEKKENKKPEMIGEVPYSYLEKLYEENNGRPWGRKVVPVPDEGILGYHPWYGEYQNGFVKMGNRLYWITPVEESCIREYYKNTGKLLPSNLDTTTDIYKFLLNDGLHYSHYSMVTKSKDRDTLGIPTVKQHEEEKAYRACYGQNSA